MIHRWLIDLIFAIIDRVRIAIERCLDNKKLVDGSKAAKTVEEKREISRRASDRTQ